jgi:hypothetical protein
VSASPVALAPPLRGRWRVENSPARRVPSHGTHRFGLTYAIDLVPVASDGRSAPRTWCSWVTSEPVEDFVGFGRPVLAPVADTVVAAHDGEPDGVARRSPLVQLPWVLRQPARVRAGICAVAGNHVVIADDAGRCVLLAHLRRGTVGVRIGDRVAVGTRLGGCGSSGNSTEPHVHLQVTDSLDWDQARGVPLALLLPGGPRVPAEGEVVDVGG